MISSQVFPCQRKAWNTLQDRIERLKQEKARLLDEWSLAMKRAYHTPTPYRHDVLRAVGDKYSDLIDVVESHIITLKASRGEFPSRLEHLLLRTGRQGIR